MPLIIKTTGVRFRLLKNVVVDDNGCWLWQGYIRKDGYGDISVVTDRGSRTCAAYKVAYIIFRGQVPDGLDLDHLCRVHACVNPWHLEPVTRQENLRRGELRWAVMHRTGLCPDGHDLTLPRAKTPQGKCRVCWNAYMRSYNQARKAVSA